MAYVRVEILENEMVIVRVIYYRIYNATYRDIATQSCHIRLEKSKRCPPCCR